MTHFVFVRARIPNITANELLAARVTKHVSFAELEARDLGEPSS